MQVHCISVSEHIWVGGCGPRGVGELPAGGIRASQGTFSSFPFINIGKVRRRVLKNTDLNISLDTLQMLMNILQKREK